METSVPAGKYVVAVSGGVDSVVLLNLLLRQKPDLDLVVAHFDHGIRKDSAKDRKFVEKLAKNLELTFTSREGNLGPNASEETARKARYNFLEEVVKTTSAKVIITAHHQDDQLETAVLNIIRGTGRRGLSSLNSSDKVYRPLLGYSKNQITIYAKMNDLKWQEDPTNADIKYLRNYIRIKLLPRFSESDKEKLLKLINNQKKVNDELDSTIEKLIEANLDHTKLSRLWLNSLDSSLSTEVIAFWLRANRLGDYDRKTLNRLSVRLRTAKPGKQIDVFSGWAIEATSSDLALKHLER